MRPMNVPAAEIRFAAKAGFLSRAIWEEFFANGLACWQRRRWKQLQERGYFIRYPYPLRRSYLVLNRKNPVVKSLVGEAISTHPFVAQVEHDDSVAKILLTLARDPKVLGFRLEPEMKREEWDQKQFRRGNQQTKYPDAVIEISTPSGVEKFALEIETSRKDMKRYCQILSSYSARKDIARVLFLSRSKLVFESLKAAMRETYYPDDERPIGFCDLDAWIRNPFKAAIYVTWGVTTLERIVRPPSSDPNTL
jgi:hypothetical protein